jgi:putative holliday junction resolvase
LVGEQSPGRIVVGLPVSLDGREHAQAGRARRFATRLEAAVAVPVALYDERFTSKLADQRGGRAGRDARAAAALLEDYLRRMGADAG